MHWLNSAVSLSLAALLALGLAALNAGCRKSEKPKESSVAKSQEQPRQPDATQNPATDQAVTAVDAPDLLASYVQDQVQADATFKGKLLTVKGTVEKVGNDPGGVPFVALRARNPRWSIHCSLDGADKAQMETLAKLKPGETIVTIKGVGNGRMGNILLKDCTIVIVKVGE